MGGVSFVELLKLYERRPGHSISVSAVPFGPGTDIWRSCWFIGALFRGLRDLPFGLRRFLFLVILVLITVGCGTLGGSGVVMVLLPGPVSLRLRIFENKLLVLFGYPDGSAAALLSGVLPLRYCSARVACKLPTWRLPDWGHVCQLVSDGVFGALVLDNDGTDRDLLPRSVGRAGGYFDGRVLGGFKRIRLNRKTPAHLAKRGNLEGLQSRSRIWKT